MKEGEVEPTVEGWIFRENLRAFVEMAAFLADYAFDQWDWDAIHFGVDETAGQRKKYYAYPLLGSQPLNLLMNYDSGGGVVTILIDSEKGLSAEMVAQLELLFEMCETYTFSRAEWKWSS